MAVTEGRLALDESVRRLIALAREEDLGAGDLSAALLPDPQAVATFSLVARQPLVLAGREIVEAVLAVYDPAIVVEWQAAARDGVTFEKAPSTLALVRGPIGSVLSAERVVLNFLQRLSGIATVTRQYADAVAGTGAKIYDTRKTTPGWRLLEKYAVRCGGGFNHRFGLHDAVLIKDNHLAGIPTQRLAGAVFEMLNILSGMSRRPSFVEVEADTLDQVRELLKVMGIDVILLDNFSADDMAAAVLERDGLGLRGKVDLEASGGLRLKDIREVAQAGVERISVGALTHSAAAVDLALERA